MLHTDVAGRSCAPCARRFKAVVILASLLTLAVTARPSLAAGPYEPNELPSTATGPLVADTDYSAALETPNDNDWFGLFTASTTALHITITTPATPCARRIRVELYDSTATDAGFDEARSKGFASVTAGETDRINYTAPGAGRYSIRVYSGDGDNVCGSGDGTPANYTLRVSGMLAPSLPMTAPVLVDADRDGVPAGRDCNDRSPSVRPGLPEIVDNNVDENCDAIVARRVRAATTLSLSRRGRRYRGRVQSTSAACVGKRRVVLRRSGSGRRSFGSARTRANGTWSISRRRLRGRVYAVVASRSSGLTVCRLARSRRIGRRIRR